MSNLDSDPLSRNVPYLPPWLRELLLAALILSVVLPVFSMMMAQYTDELIRQASDPDFKNGIRLLVTSHSAR